MAELQEVLIKDCEKYLIGIGFTKKTDGLYKYETPERSISVLLDTHDDYRTRVCLRMSIEQRYLKTSDEDHILLQMMEVSELNDVKYPFTRIFSLQAFFHKELIFNRLDIDINQGENPERSVAPDAQ